MALDSVPAQLVPETDSQISKWERPILDFYVTRGKKLCTGTTDIYKGYVMRKSFSKSAVICNFMITLMALCDRIYIPEMTPSLNIALKSKFIN